MGQDEQNLSEARYFSLVRTYGLDALYTQPEKVEEFKAKVIDETGIPEAVYEQFSERFTHSFRTWKANIDACAAWIAEHHFQETSVVDFLTSEISNAGRNALAENANTP